MYGKNQKLKEFVYLVIVGGEINFLKLKDWEEVREIEKMYNFIKWYKFENNFRWI